MFLVIAYFFASKQTKANKKWGSRYAGISVRRARSREHAGTHPMHPTRSIYHARKTVNVIVSKWNEDSPKSNHDNEFDAFDEELDSNWCDLIVHNSIIF